MNNIPKDVRKIIVGYRLQDRIKTWIKDTIFKIVTSDMYWRPYGIESNVYQECRTLDDYLSNVTMDLYLLLSQGTFCTVEGCPGKIRIGTYIPCIETMDGNEIDSLQEEFENTFGMNKRCTECTTYIDNEQRHRPINK